MFLVLAFLDFYWQHFFLRVIDYLIRNLYYKGIAKILNVQNTVATFPKQTSWQYPVMPYRFNFFSEFSMVSFVELSSN